MTKEQNGKVIEIYICPDKGLPMSSVTASRAIAGRGLEGDRYAMGRGAFSNSKTYKIRHLSLISRQAVDEANELLSAPYPAAETRRNVVVDGMKLNDMIGISFTIGNVTLRGTSLCEPCERPDNITGKSGFKDAFYNLGGLRAEVLTSGLIAVGSEVQLR